MPATPAAPRKAIAPSHDQSVLAAACPLTWYWLADLWAAHGIPWMLGHALSMKALHGGQTQNDQIDSPKIAALLRGGRLPQASVSPAKLRITSDDALLGDVARTIVHTAKHPDATTRSRLQTVPGLGTLLGLVLLYAMHAINRVPRGQDLVSSCRLGNCAMEAAGKRLGTSGAKIGQAPLTWACAAAAVLCLRAHPAAQQSLARLEHKHDTGNAWTGLAQTLARAVEDLLQPQGACEREQGFQRSGRGADKPGAALDTHGTNLQEAPDIALSTASLNAKAPRGHDTLSPAPLMGLPLSLLFHPVLVANGLRGLPLPRAWLSRDHADALSPLLA